jgi:PIN domain nuclease of toxin-antitoxin system
MAPAAGSARSPTGTRLLLDTQVWLWMLAAPERLSAKARALLVAPENELVLSAASAWEIAIKHALGKLQLPEPPAEYVSRLIAQSGVSSLPVHHHHALCAGGLPAIHRDPFDRMLVAQAQLESLPILTADRIFRRYDVRTLAA